VRQCLNLEHTLSTLATLGAYSPGVLIPHVATTRGEMKLLQVLIIGSAVCSVSVHVNHLVDRIQVQKV
jgi:hypothetical protein